MTGPKRNSEFCLPEILNSNKRKKKPRKNGFYLTLAGTQICRVFKEHDLITCEWNVPVVVSLGTRDTFSSNRKNVFEFGGIARMIDDATLDYVQMSSMPK